MLSVSPVSIAGSIACGDSGGAVDSHQAADQVTISISPVNIASGIASYDPAVPAAAVEGVEAAAGSRQTADLVISRSPGNIA